MENEIINFENKNFRKSKFVSLTQSCTDALEVAAELQIQAAAQCKARMISVLR